jgi:predicted DNA-binding transcriptional regulator YafY
VGRPQALVSVRTEDLLAISAAVRASEVLRFDYGALPSDEPGPPRRVEPHHVVMWGGRWYLVAWDLDRADWRTFRVDRMSHLRQPTGPRFAPRELPAKDVASYIASKFATPALPCRGEIRLYAPAEVVARWSSPSTVVEPEGPDRCRVVATSWSWGGLAAWAGLFDADLEIIGPPELAEAAARLADRFARATPTVTPTSRASRRG